MVALHQAVLSLKANEASMALVCGANLILNPDMVSICFRIDQFSFYHQRTPMSLEADCSSQCMKSHMKRAKPGPE